MEHTLRLAKSLLAMSAVLASVTATVGVAATQASAATPLPARVFAPYFEAWTGQSPAALSQQSGAKHLTMAFLQTAARGSCTLLWNGDASMPVASATFGADINTIRSRGGDVIPSFGGFTADNTGTELADSCTNVNSIAGEFQRLITTYDISRIDLDIEDNSLTNTAGIDRRNKAIKMTEDWAAANGRNIQFSYTLPTATSGLVDTGLNVLRNAVSNNARIDFVNIMTFDYFDGQSHQMAQDTMNAANGLHTQLGQIFSGRTSAQLWNMVNVTEMIGVDDFGPGETFATADASTVLSWARNTGISGLSFWALQRDNGNCAGSGAADNCSGIAQSTWFFSQTFAPFTSGGGGGQNDFSVSVNPTSATIRPGQSSTATVSTSVVSGSAQSVSLSSSGAPAGATVSFNPASVNAGGSSTMTVATSASTPLGTFSITVTGRATSGSHTSTFSLTTSNGTPPPPGALANPGFESGAMAPWVAQPGDAVVTSPVHSGTRAVRLSPTDSQTGEVDQAITLQPNHSYTLRGWVQGNFAFIGVSGGANASTWVSSASYTQLSVPFTTGASGAVTVFVHGWFSQGTVFADDFSVT
jgi:glycosyl hydrolase family 18 (putative chitinase)/carbohydrate binding protein with CBM4/9 domain